MSLDGGGQQAAGQEHLAGQAVAQHPQHLVADVRLQAVDGQHDALLAAQQPAQALRVGRGEGAEFVIAVEQVADGALGEDDAAAGELLMDLGDAAVLGVAEAADQGDDVEAELVVGQGEVGFGLGAVGAVVARAGGVGAAADAQRQAGDGVEGRHGAVVGVVDGEALAALGAVGGDRLQRLGAGRARTGSGAWHGRNLLS